MFLWIVRSLFTPQRMGPIIYERCEPVLAAITRIRHEQNARRLVIWYNQRMFFSLRQHGVSRLPVSSQALKCWKLTSGAWLSDPLNEYLMGRCPVIFIAAILSLIPMIGAAVFQNWIQLLVCRLLLGIGMSCEAAVGEPSMISSRWLHLVPIYAAETAPTSIRGHLTQWTGVRCDDY